MQEFISLMSISATVLAGLIIGFSLTVGVSRYVLERIKKQVGSYGSELTAKYHYYKQKSYSAVFYSIALLSLTLILCSIGLVNESFFVTFLYNITILIFAFSLLFLVTLSYYLASMLRLGEPNVGNIKNRNTKIYNKKINYIIIAMILVLSIIMLWASSSSYEYRSSGKIYSFNLNVHDGENKIYANDFNFYYDFTNKIGSLKLYFNNDYNIRAITIDFPLIIKNDDVSVRIFDHEKNKWLDQSELGFEKETKENPINFPEYTTLILDGFSKNLSQKEFRINFSLNLEPNSLFHIYYYPEKFIPYQDKDFIELDLGEYYSCFGNCVVYTYNLEIDSKTVGNKIYLDNFKNEEIQHSFALTTRDENILFWKNLLLAIGASLLSGITLFIFQKIER